MISEHANPLAALGEGAAGAQNLHVAELSAALTRAGHDVTVYTRRDGKGQPVEEFAPQGYRVVHVPAGPAKHVPKDDLLQHMGQFTRYLRTRWREEPPDVVHSHYWMSGLAAVFAGTPDGAPIVHTYHGLGAVKRRHLGKADPSPADRIRLERLVGRSVNRVVATCAEEVRELSRMGITGPHVSCVPSGVNCEQFHPEGPTPPKSLPYRVVAAGKLSPRKGFAELIAALTRNADTELVIAGGPDRGKLGLDPEARRLRALAEHHRVAGRVRLVGQVSREEMAALMRSADLVACAPWYEPSGIVPLEAMACGVPVLATAVGGLTDTVVDGVTGVLVPPRRLDVLAATMRTLLADPVKREFLGASGRERAEIRYPWDRIAEETARVYEECTDRATAEVGGVR